MRSLITKRERQIIAELIEGRTVKAIAAKLGCSPHTVDAHCVSIYKKLDVHSRVALLRWAIANGFEERRGEVHA
jgi:DNA-binding CsgD family transcriptional regulator